MRRVRTALLLILALAASALSFADRMDARAAAPGDGRPVVLVVHGRGHLAGDSAWFRTDALRALREGAFRVAGDSLLADDDVRIVWYADLLDSRRDARAGGRCDSAASALELDGSPASVLRPLALILSSLLDANAAEHDEADVKSIAGDLRFFGDVSRRCAAEGRIADAIARAHAEGRPVILVAHSLGALVTWGHLQHRSSESGRDQLEIRRLVTVGSPLGLQELRELLLGDSSPVALPRGVRSWVNIVNETDPFASRLIVSDSTGAVRALAGISDAVTTLGDGAVHELHNYLRDASTARAVLGAWCDGLSKREQTAGCARLLK